MNIKTLEYVLPKTIFIVLHTYTKHRVDKIHEFQSEDFLSDYCQKK